MLQGPEELSPAFPVPWATLPRRLGAHRAVPSSSATSTAAVPTQGCSLLLPHTKVSTQVGQGELRVHGGESSGLCQHL